MKSLSTIFFCLLTTVLCLSSINTSAYTMLLTARKAMTASNPQAEEGFKIKGGNKEAIISTIQRGEGSSHRGSKSGEDGDDHELIYHIDYHGVTTHPNPAPKHPMP